MRTPVVLSLGLALLMAGALPAVAGRTELLAPDKLVEEAPESYKIKFETSKGDFVIEVTRELAPLGADRFYNLVKNGFYDDVRFFRVVPGFVVQFGINGDPGVNAWWRNAKIDDDEPGKGSNTRGTISFATSGKNTRTTQVFISFGNNSRLDRMGFTPFGKVVEGMAEVVDQLNDEYGGAPSNQQPKIQSEGNAYLEQAFPNLDFVKQATIVE